MRRNLVVATVALAMAYAAVVLGRSAGLGDDYELQLLMPSADASFVGGQVRIKGDPVGRIDGIEVRDGQAVVTVQVDGDRAPLPAGTRARVEATSVIGARVIELLPGKEGNPTLESGSMITDSVEPVELDQVLAALDPETRESVKGLVAQIEGTVNGREANVNQTLEAAGPTFQALGEILRAVGKDGPAIRELVTELHKVTGSLASRDQDIAGTISDVDTLVRAVAARNSSLSKGLEKLPGTIDQATSTLRAVDPAVGASRGLLQDLQPAAARLPGVAAKLSPVLQQLRPVSGDLRSVLESASVLLQDTPAVLDTTHATFPDAATAVDRAGPMVNFLRPYTPELAGWLSNWTGIFGSENKAGNYARALITTGASAVGIYPGGVNPPGIERADTPAPGSIVGQPWTDANGDDIR